MIVTLTPRPEFTPVPHVEIRMSESSAWDGGDPDTDGGDILDGGAPSTGSSGFDAGNPSTLSVELPAGTDTITVWWSSQGRSDKVAGAVRRGFGGTFGHLDVEAGFDVATSYEVECFSGSTPLGRVPLGDAILPWVGDPHGCLIQQPLNPYLNATVVNLSGSWAEMSWEAPGELVRTQGAEYPSLVGFGPRQGATGVPVDFGAPTREIASRVRATLGTQDAPQLPVWLIRTHQGILPRRFYAHVKSLREVDMNIVDGEEFWSQFLCTVAEIARPAPGLQIAPLSYDDLDAAFPDGYDTRDAAFASYDAMDTAWEYAGMAGS